MAHNPEPIRSAEIVLERHQTTIEELNGVVEVFVGILSKNNPNEVRVSGIIVESDLEQESEHRKLLDQIKEITANFPCEVLQQESGVQHVLVGGDHCAYSKDALISAQPFNTGANKNGTIGVCFRNGGKSFVIGSGHVMAQPMNFPNATVGDVVCTWDQRHGGEIVDIATLSQWSLIDKNNSVVDAALAELKVGSECNPLKIRPDIPIQRVLPMASSTHKEKFRSDLDGKTVYKCGYATDSTVGFIKATRRTKRLGGVRYKDQIMIQAQSASNFSDKGDSGALVYLKGSNGLFHAVGILNGGEEKKGVPGKYSYATLIYDVIDHFGIAEMVE